MRKKKEDFFDNIWNGAKGGSKFISRGDKKPLYLPKSVNQQKYVDALNQDDVSLIFSVGPAGTGKTLFACMYAIQELKKKKIDKIVLTRPVVTVDEDIGFLPGDINRKMDPWTRPIFDIFLEVFSQRELDMMIQNGVIVICPLAFMRGRTFKKTFILSDEMQNSSPNQMMMIATRIGEGSKMVITGDLNQSDRSGENGLKHFLDKISIFERQGGELDGLAVCFLENGDIERSPIVAKVLNIWSGQRSEAAQLLTQKAFAQRSLLTTNLVGDLQSPDKLPKTICKCINGIEVKPKDNDAALIPIQHMHNNENLKL